MLEMRGAAIRLKTQLDESIYTHLKYPPDKLRLLQKISAQNSPFIAAKSAMEYNNQIIAWKHDENDPSKHLTVDPTPGSGDIYSKAKFTD